MPNDNALLPADDQLGYLPDDLVISYLARARESIRFEGTGYRKQPRVCSRDVGKILAHMPWRWFHADADLSGRLALRRIGDKSSTRMPCAPLYSARWRSPATVLIISASSNGQRRK